MLGTAGTSLQLALSPVHSNFKSVFASKLWHTSVANTGL